VVQPYDRAAFAANMAEELIRAGVRCVVAAGWAVEDTAAEVFARRFYAELLDGSRFIDAVAAAREAAWNANPQGNTWAAYQCYGDPAWSWRPDAASAVGSAHALQEFTHLPDAQALILALDTLAVRARYGAAQGAALAKGLDALRALDAQLGPTWGHQGAVAEAFGLAYAQAGLVDEALAWLERAEAATDGGASYRASEQHANLMARRAPKLGDAAKALADVQRAIARLQALQALQPTAQRHALLGSAYKRLTLLHHAAGRRQAEMQALAQGARHYELAERGHLAASRLAGTPQAALHEAARGYYPALNAQAMHLRWALLQPKATAMPRVRSTGIEAALRAAAERDPDFWTRIGPLELRLMRAIAARRLQSVAEPLAEAWASLHQRVPTAHLWESVRTTAALLLEPYQQRATKAEREAALMLLGCLKRLAAATT
jgi:tetratricopeptide (TPR) repeat protein